MQPNPHCEMQAVQALFFFFQWEGLLCFLHSVKHPLTKQGKASSAIHRPFDQLQFGDMSFHHSVVDWPG
jgi:hypothetical protein